MTKDLAYCGQLVRDNDYDRFLISLFLPSPRREALWSLFAFNHEIAKTRETVSETKLGLIRLQWWREAIAAIYEGEKAPEHQVVQDLGKAIEKFDLPREDFDTLIYAREFDLEDVQPGHMEGFLHYADLTTTPLSRLCLRCEGVDLLQEPVQAVSLNYAVTGLVMAVRFHAAQSRYYLPANMTRERGIRVDGINKGKFADQVAEIVKLIVEDNFTNVETNSRILRGMQGLSVMNARLLRRASYNIFDELLLTKKHLKALKMLAFVNAPWLFPLKF